MKKSVLLYMALVLILTLMVFVPDINAEECLSYEPVKVKLTGIISEETVPGPPEYNSIQKGDRPDKIWVLKLSKAVCVKGNPKDELNNADENNVGAVQLVFLGKESGYRKYKNFLSRDVAVTGALFRAHTIHHRTNVLIEVDEIRLSTKK